MTKDIDKELTHLTLKLIVAAEEVLYLANNDESRADAWADELEVLERAIDDARKFIK